MKRNCHPLYPIAIVVLSFAGGGCTDRGGQEPSSSQGPISVAKNDASREEIDSNEIGKENGEVEVENATAEADNTSRESDYATEPQADSPEAGDFHEPEEGSKQGTEEREDADPDGDTPTLPDDGGAEAATIEPPAPPRRLDPPEGALRADPNPESEVWIDPERRAVIVHGIVCFRDGPLEMFACPRRTKEHESVVAVHSSAQLVHAALLGIGAEPGEPVKFVPEFRPPTGTEIEVQVEWENENGEWQAARAQDWVRDVRTQEAMDHPWVFAGSGFWRDPDGNEHYQAEAGDFICVSNFASATLDIPVESTQANEGLAFEAFTERIPPLGTPVRLILTPKIPAQTEGEEGGVNENGPPLQR